jgi:hypothetical protein
MKLFMKIGYKPRATNIKQSVKNPLTHDKKLKTNKMYFRTKFCILIGICSWKLLRRRRTIYRILFLLEESLWLLPLVFGLCFTVPKSFKSSVSEPKDFMFTISISSMSELSTDVDFLAFFVLAGDTSGVSVSVRAELSETANGAAKIKMTIIITPINLKRLSDNTMCRI